MRLIDADALTDELCEDCFGVSKCPRRCAKVTIVGRMPTIDPVKHGKWIEVKNKWGGLGIICSECGAQMPRDGWGNAMQCDYCPNCGARMEGEENV